MNNANLRPLSIAAAGTALYLACVWFLPSPSASARQESKSCATPSLTSDTAREGKDGKKPTPIFYGSAACVNKGCHGGEPPQKWIVGRELIIRGNESLIYSEHDKHNDAFNVLKGARGKRMAAILGYDVTKAKQCLTCHSVYIEDSALRKKSLENYFNVEEGISCVACHGAYEEWVGYHSILVNARRFRELTPEMKEAQYGMANLRNPVRQAELCNSCHIGNLEEGKFVTHDMYAAGHPPLSAFDVATWSEQMPRHWQYLSEKSSNLQKELGLRQGELERAQLTVVGSLVSFRDSMRLLIRQACESRKTTDPQKKGLDLSNYDCWACHHDIRKPSARQERYIERANKGDKFVAGRVPWRSWPSEMVPASLDHISLVDSSADVKRKQFQAGMKQLEDAFNARAFGNPEMIEKAARELLAWCDAVIPQAQKAYATKDSSRALLDKMATRYALPSVDYDATRLVGWNFGTLYDAIHGPKGGDMQLRTALAGLSKELKLNLPAGRKSAIENELTQSLNAINRYNGRDKDFLRLWDDVRKGFRVKE